MEPSNGEAVAPEEGKKSFFMASEGLSWRLGKQDMESALDEFGRSLKDVISRWENVLPE